MVDQGRLKQNLHNFKIMINVFFFANFRFHNCTHRLFWKSKAKEEANTLLAKELASDIMCNTTLQMVALLIFSM